MIIITEGNDSDIKVIFHSDDYGKSIKLFKKLVYDDTLPNSPKKEGYLGYLSLGKTYYMFDIKHVIFNRSNNNLLKHYTIALRYYTIKNILK